MRVGGVGVSLGEQEKCRASPDLSGYNLRDALCDVGNVIEEHVNVKQNDVRHMYATKT